MVEPSYRVEHWVAEQVELPKAKFQDKFFKKNIKLDTQEMRCKHAIQGSFDEIKELKKKINNCKTELERAGADKSLHLHKELYDTLNQLEAEKKSLQKLKLKGTRVALVTKETKELKNELKIINKIVSSLEYIKFEHQELELKKRSEPTFESVKEILDLKIKIHENKKESLDADLLKTKKELFYNLQELVTKARSPIDERYNEIEKIRKNYNDIEKIRNEIRVIKKFEKSSLKSSLKLENHEKKIIDNLLKEVEEIGISKDPLLLAANEAIAKEKSLKIQLKQLKHSEILPDKVKREHLFEELETLELTEEEFNEKENEIKETQNTRNILYNKRTKIEEEIKKNRSEFFKNTEYKVNNAIPKEKHASMQIILNKLKQMDAMDVSPIQAFTTKYKQVVWGTQLAPPEAI